jgi:iron complex outermembrane receptor protein
VSVPGDPAIVFRNNGWSDTNGAEAQLRYRPTPHTLVTYAHAYAHESGRVLSALSPETYVPATPSTPVHTRSLLVAHRFGGGFEASAAYYKLSNIKFFGGDNTGDYNTLDLRVAQRLRLGRTRGELALAGQHLTGDYFDYDDQGVFDKRFFLSLRLETD